MNEQEPQATIVENTDAPLDSWMMVEIFGHTKIAGRVTERKIGTAVMIQVDVPKGMEKEFSHTQMFGPAAIFSMTPTSEKWCRQWASAYTTHGYAPLPYIPEAPKLIEEERYHEPNYQDEERINEVLAANLSKTKPDEQDEPTEPGRSEAGGHRI